ncbi:MAG: Gfo/Idh/MocA family oxidoreductase [Pseudomonadota bacterium]
MSVRIAVIGAGIMGADHARIIADDVPGSVLQVVCDLSAERAREIAEMTGAVDVATDPNEVIHRADVDAVLIASPDDTHAPLTLRALDLGKPVLCEKPLAPGSDACWDVINKEIQIGRQLVHLGFMRRFDPSYAAMKQAVDDGVLGVPIMMHNMHRNVSAPPSFTGAMAITNSAPHEFDIARFVLGTDYVAVSAFQPKAVDSARAGAPVLIILETTDGQLVNIEINNNAVYGYDVRGELVGEKGAVSLNAASPTRLDLDQQSVTAYAADWRPRFAEAYRLQDKAWIRSIETDKPSAIAANAWDGYCSSRVAEAGVRALLEGQKVMIDMAVKPSLYAVDSGAEREPHP